MRIRILAILAMVLAAFNVYAYDEVVTMSVGETKTIYLPGRVTGLNLKQVNFVSTMPNNVQVWSFNNYSCTIKAVAPVRSTSTCLINARYYYYEWVGGYMYERIGSYDFRIKVDASDPTSVSLPNNITLEEGDSYQLEATLLPDGAQSTLSWSSSNYSVASVSSDGFVTANSEGFAYITVRTGNGLNASCYVTVTKPRLGISCDKSGGLVEKGTKVSLKSSVDGADIYYTTDGTTPTTKSKLYKSPINVNRDMTIKAFATCSGYNDSYVLTNVYKITGLIIKSVDPIDGIKDAKADIIPSISYNGNITKGAEFSTISLKKNNSFVDGEVITSDNTLYFVPAENLEQGAKYYFSIPENSLVNLAGEPNIEYSMSFTVAPKSDIPLPMSISAGWFHSAVVKSDGSLWTWGDNYHGVLGNGGGTTNDSECVLVPTKVISYGVKSVYANCNNTAIIKQDNSLWMCGSNGYGQLGDGSRSNITDVKSYFVRVKSGVSDVCVGDTDHNACITTDGTLYEWGIMNDINNFYVIPVKMKSGILDVYSTWDYSAIVKKDKSLYLYRNGKESATEYKILDDVEIVSDKVAFKTDGSLWTYSLDTSIPPKKIMDGVKFVTVGVAGDCAIIKIDGSLWCMEYKKEDFKKIMDDVVLTAVGGSHYMAVKKDGSLWIWGSGKDGALGNGTFDGSDVPIKIMDGVEFTELKSIGLTKELTLHVGQKSLLKLICNPIDADYESVEWSSSDEDVVSVSSRGVLTAKSKGTATVAVAVIDTNGKRFEAQCKVTVTDDAGVAEVADGEELRLSVAGGRLTVAGLDDGEDVNVYNAMGALVGKGAESDGSAEVELRGGGVLVVVTSNGRSTKIICNGF